MFCTFLRHYAKLNFHKEEIVFVGSMLYSLKLALLSKVETQLSCMQETMPKWQLQQGLHNTNKQILDNDNTICRTVTKCWAFSGQNGFDSDYHGHGSERDS